MLELMEEEIRIALALLGVDRLASLDALVHARRPPVTLRTSSAPFRSSTAPTTERLALRQERRL